MKSVTVIMFSVSVCFAQEREYGEKNGYDWQSIGSSIVENINKTKSLENKSWIEGVTFEAKQQYIQGMVEVMTRIPTVTYQKYFDEKGREHYYEVSHAYPYLFGIYPGQIVKGLDKFYDDYKNMNVIILEAIHIVQMEIKGSSGEEIDWQTRYYRANRETRSRMILEKIPPPPKKKQ